MLMEEKNSKPDRIDDKVRVKQKMAEKLAAQLRHRAGVLRKFAEKNRNQSAESLHGWYSSEDGDDN